MPESAQSLSIKIERHNDIVVIIPTPELEKLPADQMGIAAQMALEPLKAQPPAGLIFDLSHVDYFGSNFLSFLLRCHKRVKENGCEVVVAGASVKARELLHQTALDTLWPLYPNRAEALSSLNSD